MRQQQQNANQKLAAQDRALAFYEAWITHHDDLVHYYDIDGGLAARDQSLFFFIV